MSKKYKNLFNLAESNEISITRITSDNDYMSPTIIKCGNYSITWDLELESIDNAIDQMVYRIKTNKVTVEDYIEFLNNSVTQNNNNDSQIPNLDLLKELDIKIAVGVTGLIYPFNDLDNAIEFVVQSNVYDTYEEIDFSEFLILYSVYKLNGKYRVRGVKKEFYEIKLAEVKAFIEAEKEE